MTSQRWVKVSNYALRIAKALERIAAALEKSDVRTK